MKNTLEQHYLVSASQIHWICLVEPELAGLCHLSSEVGCPSMTRTLVFSKVIVTSTFLEDR